MPLYSGLTSTLNVEAAWPSGILVSTFKTARCQNPQEHNINFCIHFSALPNLAVSNHFILLVLVAVIMIREENEI
jgi:hypothetical protein